MAQEPYIKVNKEAVKNEQVISLNQQENAIFDLLVKNLTVSKDYVTTYFVLWVRAQQKQYTLNRQLIAALVKSDTKQAIVLVETGADPNTREEPTPTKTLSELVKRLLSHSSPDSVNKTINPTAFMMACKVGWLDDDQTLKRINAVDIHLLQTMMLHGANVNAVDRRKWTALHSAIMFSVVKDFNEAFVKKLLDAGADPNIRETSSGNAWTAIEEAEAYLRPDLVALLCKYNQRP